MIHVMFSLLYGLFEYMLRKDEFHILILGIDKAGKTNFLEKMKTMFTDFVGLDPSKILPTVGLNVGRMEAFNTNLIFWDLGGQQGLRSIWDKYFDETHAVIYVVDSACPQRFDESKLAMEKVLGARELFGAPFLIVANKQDIEGAVSPQAIAEHFGVGKLDSRPFKVQAVSTYNGQGVHDSVAWLVSTIRRSPRLARMKQRYKNGF